MALRIYLMIFMVLVSGLAPGLLWATVGLDSITYNTALTLKKISESDCYKVENFNFIIKKIDLIKQNQASLKKDNLEIDKKINEILLSLNSKSTLPEKYPTAKEGEEALLKLKNNKVSLVYQAYLLRKMKGNSEQQINFIKALIPTGLIGDYSGVSARTWGEELHEVPKPTYFVTKQELDDTLSKLLKDL